MSTATLEAPTMDADAALREAMRPKKKDTGKTPSISIPEASALVRKLELAKIAEKDAVAYRKSLQADCMALVEPHRIRLSREAKKCLSSLQIDNLMLIHQNRYIQIKDRDEDDDQGFCDLLQTETDLMVGCARHGLRFDEMFIEQWNISVDRKNLSPEQKIQLAGMSPEGFRLLKPTPAFHTGRTLTDRVKAFADEFHLAPIAYFKA